MSEIFVNATAELHRGNNLSGPIWITNDQYRLAYDLKQHKMLAPMIFVGILAIIGIPGNILVLVVFTSKHKPSVYRTVIITLAVYDLLVSGITLPFEFYDLYHYITFQGKWVCKIFKALNYFFIFNSSSIIQLLAVERFRRVCKPLKSQLSPRIAIICVSIISLACGMLTIPNLFIRGIRTISLANNATGHDCTISDEYIETDVPLIYNGSLIATCICNISAVIVLYVLIRREIHKHFQFLKRFKPQGSSHFDSKHMESKVSSSSHQKNTITKAKSEIFSIVQEKEASSLAGNDVNARLPMNRKTVDGTSYKSTKIAVMISIFFVLSYIPTLAENLLAGVFGQDVLSKYVSLPILNILEKLYGINHVVNPFIYALFDITFRKHCKELLSMLRCIVTR